MEQLSNGSSDVFPSSHEVHSVDPVLFACRPATQAMQESALLAANWLLYLPRSHLMHWALPVAAGVVLYFPFSHLIHDRSAVDRIGRLMSPY